MPTRNNKIFIITGPSGVGKDTVMRDMQSYNLPLQRVTTTTSRPMRAGETQGQPYYFISEQEFSGMIERGEFAEYARVFDSWKGTTHKELAEVANGNLGALLQMDYQGARTILSQYPETKVIVITPPSIEILNERLIRRGDKHKEDLAKRLEQNKRWHQDYANFHYYIENEQDHPEKAAATVAAIIKKEVSVGVDLF